MESLAPFLAVGGVLALIGVIIAVSSQMEKKRTEALLQASRMLGFTFEPAGDPEQLKTLGDLPLYAHGHSRRASNVLSGRSHDGEVKLFDYRYTTGSGKNSHTWNQTVALFPEAARGLPDFLLAPENIFHKIGSAFGYQDIDFDSAPDFSSHYLLRGPDEAAIRSAFGATALSFFSQQKGWHVETKSGTVGVYRSDKRCKPEDVRTFLDEARAVVRAFTGH